MCINSNKIIKKRGSFFSQDTDINYILYKPIMSTTFPAVIFHPGNRLYPEDYEWLHYRIAKNGYVVLALYQRGYGSGENKINDRAGPIQQRDMRNALSYFKKQNFIQQDRIGAIGHSNGAGLSVILAALQPEVKCVVSMSMIADWGEFVSRLEKHLPEYYQEICKEFNGSPFKNKTAYYIRSCIHLAHKVNIPVYTIVGKDDTITPPYQSKLMLDKLKKSGNKNSTLSLVPNIGHFYEKYSFSGYETGKVADEIANWIKKTL